MMENNVLKIDGGGTNITYSLVYEDTRKYFRGYAVAKSAQIIIQVTREYMQKNIWLVNGEDVENSLLEFHCLMLATGTKILADRRALFHGAAFLWNGLAWIITAPSGTGKTTQLRNWLQILGHDVRTINGDKPFMECRDDGTVWVYSSPWRGKEGYGHPGMCAKLGGIILLEQGKENKITRMTQSDAVVPLLGEIIATWDNTDIIQGACTVLNSMLNAVPVWKLVNTGDLDSTQLTIDTLAEELGKTDNVRENDISCVPSVPDNQWYMRSGVVLVCIQGEYFLLADDTANKNCNWIRKVNELGAFIWKCITENKSKEEVIACIREEYEVPEGYDLEKDVNTFLAELKDNNYLV